MNEVDAGRDRARRRSPLLLWEDGGLLKANAVSEVDAERDHGRRRRRRRRRNPPPSYCSSGRRIKAKQEQEKLVTPSMAAACRKVIQIINKAGGETARGFTRRGSWRTFP